MTITTNISYTQEMVERIMARSLLASEGRLNFESTYGCGDFLNAPPSKTIDLEKIKEGLFSEYDDLWKELANR